MTLQRAELDVSADVDGDGVEEDATFVFAGNVEVTPSLRTGYLIGGRGSTVNSIISQFAGSGDSKRRNFFLEAGGGAHTIEISFRGWEGATDNDGNPAQWGDTGDQSTVTKSDATGADPITQVDVLMKYLTVAEIDSRNPATLRYGEYSLTGLYEPLSVVVESPNFSRAAEDGSWFDGSMTCVAAADIRDLYDAAERRER